MTVKTFDSLPPINGKSEARLIDWDKARRDLIANEGLWVLMAENISNSTPQQLRTGKYRAFPPNEMEHFEFSVRKPENPQVPYGKRRTDLYGRYTAKS